MVFGIGVLLVRGTVQRIETRRPPGTHRSPRPRSSSWGSAGERLAGLEQGLQATEDERPATGDVLGGLRRVLEPVVRDGHEGEAVLALDLPRHAAGRLRRRFRVVERAPLVDEAVRRL